MKTNHTPTPWIATEIGLIGADGTHIIKEGALSYPLAAMEADEAFIVRAVNSHDALVEALESAIDMIFENETQRAISCREQARKALELAKC